MERILYHQNRKMSYSYLDLDLIFLIYLRKPFFDLYWNFLLCFFSFVLFFFDWNCYPYWRHHLCYINVTWTWTYPLTLWRLWSLRLTKTYWSCVFVSGTCVSSIWCYLWNMILSWSWNSFFYSVLSLSWQFHS